MKKMKGFTLVELMIAVAIVAILAAVAIPAYDSSVTQSRRTECKVFAMDIADRQARNWTQNSTYAEATSAAQFTNNLNTPNGNLSENSYCTASTTGGDSFLVTVTPSIADSECVSFTLTNTGIRGVGDGSTLSVSDCWR